jgi:hypothetical protein
MDRLCILAGERGVGRRGQIYRARGGTLLVITHMEKDSGSTGCCLLALLAL